MRELPVDGGTFVIVSNGFADGPAEALRPFLLDHGARCVVDVSHPLVAEGPTGHRIIEYHADGREVRRTIDPRLRPPLSFGLDLFLPPRVERSTGWFGFNCIATARGIAERRLHRTERVVHWSVDFVPQRFGPGRLTQVYEAVDSFCCKRADARVDLSGAALEARDTAYSLTSSNSAPSSVVPMGCWLDRTPTVQPAAATAKRVVFLGHLVPRMGVLTLLDALELLRADDPDVTAEIVGGGPLLDEVRRRAATFPDGAVTVHGFVEDHREVESILAGGTVAAAPYTDDADSFTRWADPGKLKAYLGAGLPIVMTSTPPIAPQLEAAGSALLVQPDAGSVAAGLAKVLQDAALWGSMNQASLSEVAKYDWPAVLSTALADFGFRI